MEGAAVGNFFGGEVEVVRAGFYGDGEAFFFRAADVGERLGGDEMDDVEAEAIFAAEANHEANGFYFSFVGAGAEPRIVAAPVWVGEVGSGAVEGFGQLGVDEEGQAGASGVGRGGAEFGFIDAVEAFDAGFGEKAFESADTGLGEGFEVFGVVGGDSAPSGPIDQALPVGGGAFGLEGGDGGGGWEAVERHVD